MKTLSVLVPILALNVQYTEEECKVLARLFFQDSQIMAREDLTTLKSCVDDALEMRLLLDLNSSELRSEEGRCGGDKGVEGKCCADPCGAEEEVAEGESDGDSDDQDGKPK